MPTRKKKIKKYLDKSLKKTKSLRKNIKKSLQKTKKVFRGGGKEEGVKKGTPKKGPEMKLSKVKPKYTEVPQVPKENIITGSYFDKGTDVKYEITHQFGNECIYLMNKPDISFSQELDLSNEVEEKLSECDLSSIKIRTQIRYEPIKKATGTASFGQVDVDSIYLPIIIAITNYMKKEKTEETELMENQDKKGPPKEYISEFKKYFDQENPFLNINIKILINFFKKYKQKVDKDAAKTVDAVDSLTDTRENANYAINFSEWISSIYDFISIISPPTKRNGKIYLFEAKKSDKEVWGIICIENNTSIMGTEFRRDKSFNGERDSIGFSIQPPKTYTVNHKYAELLSIVIRLLLCCDKVHDLKGRGNTPTEINKIVKNLRRIINKLKKECKLPEQAPQEIMAFYNFAQEIFKMWEANEGIKILNSIEESLLYLFLCLTKSLEGRGITLNTDKSTELSGINYIIDNGMGRETEINTRFKDVRRVISASTLFDGGCKLSTRNQRYPLLGEDIHILSEKTQPIGNGKGRIDPYTIDFGTWKFSRNLFARMDIEDKKKNINQSGLFVSIHSLEPPTNKFRTLLHFFLDRKYSAASIAKDEAKIEFKLDDSGNLYVPNQELFTSLRLLEPPSNFIKISDGVLTHEIIGGEGPEDNFYNTKGLCDVGQCCELFASYANQYATIHNDISAAIFQMILQFVLFFGGAGYYKPPETVPSGSSVLSAASASGLAAAMDENVEELVADKAYLCKISLDTQKKTINSEEGNISCNKGIVDTDGLLFFGKQLIQEAGTFLSPLKRRRVDYFTDKIKKLYSIYEYCGLFKFDESTSSEFYYELSGYNESEKSYSENIMEEPLEKRSLVHYILKSSNLNEFNAFLKILSREDREEFILFVNYNTILIHKTCSQLDLDLKYPGIENQIKLLDIRKLLYEINKYFEFKCLDKVNRMIGVYYQDVKLKAAMENGEEGSSKLTEGVLTPLSKISYQSQTSPPSPTSVGRVVTSPLYEEFMEN